MNIVRISMVLLVALLLAACGTTTSSSTVETVTYGPIRVVDAWARATPAGMAAMADTTATADSHGGMDMGGLNSAIYFTIKNAEAADRLLKVESDVAGTVELHTVTNNNGVMEMRPVEGIDVPANGEAQLKPGGFHVMLLDLKAPLKVGDTVHATLQFEKAGPITIEAEVRER